MRDFSDLRHTVVPVKGGGQIVIPDVGAVLDSEAQAMLGALYSRSPASVLEHLKLVSEKGPEKFMSTYYVQYGHKSIGDMAPGIAFFENISLLAAKAIQDFPLYNGQEVSTRYVDFSKQAFIDPLDTEASKAALEDLRAFYLRGLAELDPVLKARFPRQEEEKEASYEKAIKARAFDTMRCLLPAGAATSVVWSGPLRQFADRLPVLRNHPLEEVRAIGDALETGLLEQYKNSFSGKHYEATEAYQKTEVAKLTYFDDAQATDFTFIDHVDHAMLAEFRDALAHRPPKAELPVAIRECGTATFNFLLDFGSFRDLQRHRAVNMRMPLLTLNHRFEPWYLGELPGGFRTETEAFLEEYGARIEALGVTPETKQYYIPSGMRTTVRLSGDLRALTYLVELRATRFVHATLRARAVQMAETLAKAYGQDGLVLHLDLEPDRFDVRRGEQDIVKKES